MTRGRPSAGSPDWDTAHTALGGGGGGGGEAATSGRVRSQKVGYSASLKEHGGKLAELAPVGAGKLAHPWGWAGSGGRRAVWGGLGN